MTGQEAVTWLFVPGSRPDRFEKATQAGADEVILDLEDAVAPGAKESARAKVASWLGSTGTGWVRINAAGTAEHEADLVALGTLRGLRGIVLPKAEDPAELRDMRKRLPEQVGILALVESALGIDRASAISRSGSVDRLAFGSIDFALDIGAEETDTAMLFARSTLVVASRAAALPAPVDGVSVAKDDDETTLAAAARARSLGFGGKLCIHPRQIDAATAGFRPTTPEIVWATRVLEESQPGGTASEDRGALIVDGQMVDLPVLLRARAILERAERAAVATTQTPRQKG